MNITKTYGSGNVGRSVNSKPNFFKAYPTHLGFLEGNLVVGGSVLLAIFHIGTDVT